MKLGFWEIPHLSKLFKKYGIAVHGIQCANTNTSWSHISILCSVLTIKFITPSCF